MSSRIPIFDFTDTFDAIVDVGRAVNAETKQVMNPGVPLPIHVKRLSRAEMEQFEKGWNTYVTTPRGDGSQTRTADEQAKFDAEALRFCEDAIRASVTLDEGLVRNRGKWVTDGAGLIDVFHARKDVLSSFLAAIYVENKLGSVIRKNSRSPLDSGIGSEASAPTTGETVHGDALARTATPADESGSVSTGAAEGNASTDEGAPSSSGETRKVH